mmetsp:Transcript_48805/g.110760  ORF Transcript_48805/g.110760 Transcript_48805/m.110760 type:complete len:394 (-) Transcript_48805:205-1386(-)|eukprot:CAMPEP_0172634340 /NCGR_PEP_ID=MMETSP1068-20121228/194035_1 /TAXON_ID=35684 /ORGANISM="Pseudopedinella elastica, Strain CCMP716" /LENGTH=393 /DNA_ID=CAMNT_0013446277 /DNA_START=151 /DNA_END=1332 /DNA_ORIENTATION=-
MWLLSLFICSALFFARRSFGQVSIVVEEPLPRTAKNYTSIYEVIHKVKLDVSLGKGSLADAIRSGLTIDSSLFQVCFDLGRGAETTSCKGLLDSGAWVEPILSQKTRALYMAPGQHTFKAWLSLNENAGPEEGPFWRNMLGKILLAESKSTVAYAISDRPAVFLPIGTNCAIAHSLRHAGMRWSSHPFDWAVTPMRTVHSFLTGNVQNLTGGASLLTGSEDATTFVGGEPFNRELQMVFPNDKSPSFDEPAFHEKYARRSKRILDTISEPPEKANVFLVYHIPKAYDFLSRVNHPLSYYSEFGPGVQEKWLNEIREFYKGRPDIHLISLSDLRPFIEAWCAFRYNQTYYQYKDDSGELLAMCVKRKWLTGNEVEISWDLYSIEPEINLGGDRD